MAKTVDKLDVDGVKANPHRYVPHDSTNITSCDACHSVHELPVTASTQFQLPKTSSSLASRRPAITSRTSPPAPNATKTDSLCRRTSQEAPRGSLLRQHGNLLASRRAAGRADYWLGPRGRISLRLKSLTSCILMSALGS